MIIVTGSVVAKPESADELMALCLEHTQRSRGEPGCISHAVHRDVENPLRMVFFEEWAHRAVLADHFAVPASREFMKAATALAASSTRLRIFEAEEIKL
jgi:quinol monooxygenase YgiN